MATPSASEPSVTLTKPNCHEDRAGVPAVEHGREPGERGGDPQRRGAQRELPQAQAAPEEQDASSAEGDRRRDPVDRQQQGDAEQHGRQKLGDRVDPRDRGRGDYRRDDAHLVCTVALAPRKTAPASSRGSRRTSVSARAATKSASWVTATTALPALQQLRKQRDQFLPGARILPEGRLVEHSTRGAVASTVATESRRFSPPDRVNGLAPASASSRSRDSRPSTRSVDLCIGQPERARADRQFGAHGRGEELVLRLLEHRADAGEQLPRLPGVRMRADARGEQLARLHGPDAGGSSPASVSASVDLPAPLTPVIAVASPASTRRSIPAARLSARAAAPADPECRGREQRSARRSRARLPRGKRRRKPRHPHARRGERLTLAPRAPVREVRRRGARRPRRARSPGRRGPATPTRGAR